MTSEQEKRILKNHIAIMRALTKQVVDGYMREDLEAQMVSSEDRIRFLNVQKARS